MHYREVRTFLWKLGHESLLTNMERQRRLMTNSGTCPICNERDETLFHRFRDCTQSMSIWISLNIKNQRNFFSATNWKNWIEGNLKHYRANKGIPYWSILFGVSLDVIWRNRNDWVFSQKVSSTQTSVIRIRNQVDCIVDCLHRKANLLPQCNLDRIDHHGEWNPPAPGFYKMNCDGSVFDHGRSSGCGGVLHDSDGVFLFVFSHRLDPCSAIEAELWAVYHGISLAIGRGYLKFEVETDSTLVVDLLMKKVSASMSLDSLIKGILDIGGRGIEVSWKVFRREFNCVADRLAKESHKIEDTCVIYDIVPGFLANVISVNGYGPAGPSLMD